MFKETIKKALGKATEATKQYIEEHSNSISDIVIGTAAVVFVLGVGINWAGKIVPSRTNLHIYIHMD